MLVGDAASYTSCGNTCFKAAKKQANTEKGKHMDLYFATCKLRVDENQFSAADTSFFFKIDLQIKFYKH